MNLIDQFIASITYDKKKVISFKDQSIWKGVFYVLVLVISTELLVVVVNPSVVPLEIIEFPIFMHYIVINLVLAEHFIFISLLAFAGRSFCKSFDLSYKQVWTITAYGISAPIIVRTILQLIGLMFTGVTLIYWGAVAFFGIIVLQGENED